MNKKPILWLGIAMIVVGVSFAIVMSVLVGANVTISSSSWYDGPASIAVGIVITILGVLATVYSTSKLKLDVGPVAVETESEPPPEVVHPPHPGIPAPGEGVADVIERESKMPLSADEGEKR